MSKIITIDNLAKSFGSTAAVQNFNLTVDEGEVVALLGGSRSGKSTILKVMASDLKPDVGFIYVCGYDTVLQAGMVRPRVGLVKHQRLLEGSMTGRDNLVEQAMLRFFTPEEAEQRAGELLALVDLGARAAEPASTYSADEWARAEMAAALIHHPRILLVDEPSRGCDAAGRQKVWAAFRKLRAQVASAVLATPDEEEANALADRVVRV